MISRAFLTALVASIVATAAHAQTVYSPGRWKFGEGGNGELAAEVWSEIGHGIKVHLDFQCNEGGRYSNISHSGQSYPVEGELKVFLDSYMDGNLKIETYKAGSRTNSFRPTGFHDGGDEVTDLRLRSVQDADLILIVGAKRPIALPATNARVAIAQLIAACGVLKPK